MYRDYQGNRDLIREHKNAKRRKKYRDNHPLPDVNPATVTDLRRDNHNQSWPKKLIDYDK